MIISVFENIDMRATGFISDKAVPAVARGNARTTQVCRSALPHVELYSSRRWRTLEHSQGDEFLKDYVALATVVVVVFGPDDRER